MAARPFVLVPATRLDALRVPAEQRVQAWARGWGLGAAVAMRAQPLDELAPDALPAGRWLGMGAGRWSWRAADCKTRLAWALYGPDVVADTPPLAQGCLDACLDELLEALDGQGAAVAGSQQEPPLGVRGGGHALLAVELDGLALAAAACAAPDAQGAAPALPRPSRADRDAGFAQVKTRAVVELGHAQATLRELAGLKPGDVLVLHQTLGHPAVLALEQGGMRLPVQLGRRGDRYAVQVLPAREPKEH